MSEYKVVAKIVKEKFVLTEAAHKVSQTHALDDVHSSESEREDDDGDRQGSAPWSVDCFSTSDLTRLRDTSPFEASQQQTP